MSWPIRVYWRSPRSHLSRRSLDFAHLSAILNCETKLYFRRIKSEFIRPGRKSLRFNWAPAIGSITNGSRNGSSRRSPGKGVQVLVRYLRPFILSNPRLWQPLTSQRSSNLRPTVRISPLPAASSTWNKVLQSHNQSHLLLTSSIFATQPRPTHKGTPRLKEGTR